VNDIIRHCPDCGGDRSLAQLHGLAGCCPDTAGADCPEWYCELCGTVLVIGEVPVAVEPAWSGRVRARVA